MFELWFSLKFVVKSIYKKLTIPALAIIALTTGLLVACQPQEIASPPQQETFTTTPVGTLTPVTSNKPIAYSDRELGANKRTVTTATLCC